LHVEVDPARRRSVRGEVAIRVAIGKPARSIEVHAAELRVQRAWLEAGGRTLRGEIEPHPERETVAVRFAERLPAGEATLRLRFAGRLREDLRGLYATRSEGRRYAFTQLEAAEARRFFPCFDEPCFKARFRISLTTDARNAAVSNGPIEHSELIDRGRKTVRFAETPLLSTYLIALAVGELEASEPHRLGPTEMRVWHVPGKRGLAALALETAADLPYPYGKLDLVAVPDFEAGAMENAGAVFFRETLLLVDPATVTLTEKKRVAEVICHELAHMWYGDLVTMAWWDDLWLNEAFATWMAFHIVDRWKPEWKMWSDFQHHRSAALRLDALRHTHPIHTEVRTPSQATENFDLITYEKGASVVRMLERYLGEKAFRAGVRTYIRRHREGNARSIDLWRALSEASGEPVEPIVRSWIEQAGLPMLSFRRREAKGRTSLEVRQQRFTAYPRETRQTRRADGARAGRWLVPCVVRVAGRRGDGRLVRKLVSRAKERIDLGQGRPRFVYGNADEVSFLRPRHEEDELRTLGSNRARLSPIERMGLLDHQWALVRAGRAPIQSFLELVEVFESEQDPDVLRTLRAPLALLEDRLLPTSDGETRSQLRAWIVEGFSPALLELGWTPAGAESEDTRLRRAVLMGILGEIAEWAPAMEAARRGFDAYLADRHSLDPNLADPVVALAARTGDANRFTTLLAAAETAATPQERRRFLMALAEFRRGRLIARACALTLTPRVPTQDVALLLARLLGNPAARHRTWEFIQQRWAVLRRRMPPMLATRLIEATPALGDRAHRRDVASFFRAHPVPAGERALQQALERFDLDQAFRRLASPGLRRWLTARPDASKRA
jgi:puromycin-sensitive aminopeptidase